MCNMNRYKQNRIQEQNSKKKQPKVKIIIYFSPEDKNMENPTETKTCQPCGKYHIDHDNT